MKSQVEIKGEPWDWDWQELTRKQIDASAQKNEKGLGVERVKEEGDGR